MTTGTRKKTPAAALARLKKAFRRDLGLGHAPATALLAGAKMYDKAYELSCLIETMSRLKHRHPSATFTLVNGSRPAFRAKGGPIDRSVWPYIEIRLHSLLYAEIWVDIECLALSAWSEGKAISGYPYGRAHELDLVIVRTGTSGRPTPGQLYVGVEAKFREFTKALLKELLGVRRETAFKARPSRNPFVWWNVLGNVPAKPPSGIVLFCSDAGMQRYSDPCDFWGIAMIHHPF